MIHPTSLQRSQKGTQKRGADQEAKVVHSEKAAASMVGSGQDKANYSTLLGKAARFLKWELIFIPA